MPDHSSTSSSEPTIQWRVELRRLLVHLVGVSMAFMVIGEAWFRLPWTTKLVIWEFDDECGARLAAPQSRGMGLGNFSSISPVISINEECFRNGRINWSEPTILALGSSETLGTGVTDDEVWTARCSEELRRSMGRAVTVVNAGSPGYGPFHQSVVLRRFLEQHRPPELVVVRISTGDRTFKKPTPGQLADAKHQNEVSRQIKRYSEFLPFLVNRMQAQAAAIRQTFRRSDRSEVQVSAVDVQGAVDRMWSGNSTYWEDIVEQASRIKVPIVFVIDGADGGEAADVLYDLFRQRYSADKHVSVELFGPAAVGLESVPVAGRRAEYVKRFTLGFDPHANAALHRRLANFLTPVLARLIGSS